MARTTFWLLEQEQKAKEKAKKAEKKKSKVVGFAELNAKEAQKAIADIDDLERLEKLLELEVEGNNRKTVIEPLETKIEELQEEDQSEGDK